MGYFDNKKKDNSVSDKYIIDNIRHDYNIPKDIISIDDLEKVIRVYADIAIKDTIAREKEIERFDDIVEVSVFVDVKRKNFDELFKIKDQKLREQLK